MSADTGPRSAMETLRQKYQIEGQRWLTMQTAHTPHLDLDYYKATPDITRATQALQVAMGTDDLPGIRAAARAWQHAWLRVLQAAPATLRQRAPVETRAAVAAEPVAEDPPSPTARLPEFGVVQSAVLGEPIRLCRTTEETLHSLETEGIVGYDQAEIVFLRDMQHQHQRDFPARLACYHRLKKAGLITSVVGFDATDAIVRTVQREDTARTLTPSISQASTRERGDYGDLSTDEGPH